ncbi:probable methyltransferase PMT21 [Tanacetum coccineum]
MSLFLRSPESCRHKQRSFTIAERCDVRTDLIPYVQNLVKRCESNRDGDIMHKIPSLFAIMMHGSTETSAKGLLHHVRLAASKGVLLEPSTTGKTNTWLYLRWKMGGCEAFLAYPRTYDLLHVESLFTYECHRCEMKHVLLEMDRILRPEGYALIRESSYFVDAVATIAKGMRWDFHVES